VTDNEHTHAIESRRSGKNKAHGYFIDPESRHLHEKLNKCRCDDLKQGLHLLLYLLLA